MSAPARQPRRHPRAVFEDVPGSGECVLLQRDSRRVIALNAMGAAVWELLDGERDAAELARILHQASGVELAQARHDVEALLEQLANEGFLA